MARLQLCPDCREGKHRNCTGEAWDSEADTLGPCECGDGQCAPAGHGSKGVVPE